MSATAIYIIGAPGVGKSTVSAIVADRLGCHRPTLVTSPVAHEVYPNGWVTLGRPRDGFPGTDTLGYSAINAVVPWVESDARPTALLAEGDRLAVDRFMTTLTDAYERFVLVHLDAPLGVSWQRAVDRAHDLGRKPQNETWWRGRAAKAANLARRWGAAEIDAERDPRAVAADVLDLIET